MSNRPFDRDNYTFHPLLVLTLMLLNVAAIITACHLLVDIL